MLEMEQNNQKKFSVLKIIPFQLGTANCQNLERDTCHWQSICYERHLRFTMSLKEMFFQPGSPRVIKKYYGSAVIQILYKFGTL